MPRGIKYGGRAKGTPNKATVERQQLLDNILIAQGIEPFPGDGVDFLKTVYRNQQLPLGIRLEAAKAAAPFERARPMPELGNIEPVKVVLQDLRRPALALGTNAVKEAVLVGNETVLVTDQAAD